MEKNQSGSNQESQSQPEASASIDNSKKVSTNAPSSAAHLGAAMNSNPNSFDAFKLILEIEQDTAPLAASTDPNDKCEVISFSPTSSKTDQTSRSIYADAPRSKCNVPNFDIIFTNEPFKPIPGCTTSNKRRRTSSTDSDSSNTALHPNKAQKAITSDGTVKKQTHHVCFTFPIQDPNLPTSGNPAQPDDAAQAANNSSRARVKIPSSAEPMWNCAKRHRTSEQKCKLRADTLATMLTDDLVPGYFMGVDKIPRFFMKDGELPTRLTDMINRQARERTQVAIDYLRLEQAKEKSRADFYDQATKDLYAQEEDRSYEEAETLMVNLLTTYRVSEKRRLEALAKKEAARKPSTRKDIANLLCKEEESYKIPTFTRGRAPTSPPKRRRAPKTPSTSPSRDRKRNRSTGRREQKPSRGPATSTSSKTTTSTTPRKSKKNAPTNQGRSNKAKNRPRSRAQSPKNSELSSGALNLIQAINELGAHLGKAKK